jgi:acyl-coenzyme A synthetase/AMP-(fatty) acid ligase
VLSDGHGFVVEALIDQCRDRLERSHVPDLIQVVDELPKTASEKVQARFLIEALGAAGAVVYEVNGIDLRNRRGMVSGHA